MFNSNQEKASKLTQIWMPNADRACLQHIEAALINGEGGSGNPGGILGIHSKNTYT